MAQFNFFDLGQATRDAQSGLALKEQKNILANRAKAQKIREQFERMPDQIDALERDGMFDEAAKLRDSYITQQFNTAKLMRTQRDFVSADNWKPYRQNMIQSGAVEPSMMPVDYSETWLREMEEKEKGKLEKLTRTWAERGAVMSQDIVQQDGSIVWEGEPYEASADRKARTGGGSGKPFEMNASDSNSIRAATASLYDSIWDPQTGRYSGLNKEQAREVAAVATEASRIYRTNNEAGISISHNEAATRAARKMNIQIRDLNRDPGNRDPLRWRDQPGAGGPQARQPQQQRQSRQQPFQQQQRRPRGPQYGPTTMDPTLRPDEIPRPPPPHLDGEIPYPPNF